MRGEVEVDAIIPLHQDPSGLALFRDSAILVAVDDERVIGFGGHKDNCISWLFVHPAYRRQGVARALLMGLMAQLQGPVSLNVGRWNLAARKLYEGLGFATVREFTGTFQGHAVEVLTLRSDWPRKP